MPSGGHCVRVRVDAKVGLGVEAGVGPGVGPAWVQGSVIRLLGNAQESGLALVLSTGSKSSWDKRVGGGDLRLGVCESAEERRYPESSSGLEGLDLGEGVGLCVGAGVGLGVVPGVGAGVCFGVGLALAPKSGFVGSGLAFVPA